MNAGPLIFLAAMAAVIWFLLIRPQRQRLAAQRSLIADLAPNEEVVTAGGLLGKVRTVDDDHVVLEIAPGTEVRVVKQAVTGVIRKDEEPASEAEGPG